MDDGTILKTLVVCGTRPEAVKMAPLCLALNANNNVDNRLCVTAQHRHMLDQVLSLFKLDAHYDLDLMKPGQDLTDVTSAVLQHMRPVLQDFKPDRVIVHGDTTTTLAATLASYYAQVPIAHVEAGLRTDDIYSPWPEEGNRLLTARLTDRHYAPTAWAKDNLLREGVSSARIVVTGNTVIDALFQVVERLKTDQQLNTQLDQQFPFLRKDKKLILVTGHRRENFGDGFERICKALKRLSQRDDVQIVYPVHLNPNVQEPVTRLLANVDAIELIEPQDYLPFVYLMNRSHMIITDSGGIQEEAPSIGKPVLVMRDTTERPEAVDAGTVTMVGTSDEKIVAEASRLLEDHEHYKRCAATHNPYGDGTACQKIIEDLVRVS